MIDLEKLERRLNDVDVQQIQVILRVPPEKRLQTMLRLQKVKLRMWYDRLRKSHPTLTALELWQLVHQRLKQNG